MRAHRFIHLDIFVCTTFSVFEHTPCFSRKSTQVFVHEAPAQTLSWLARWHSTPLEPGTPSSHCTPPRNFLPASGGPTWRWLPDSSAGYARLSPRSHQMLTNELLLPGLDHGRWTGFPSPGKVANFLWYRSINGKSYQGLTPSTTQLSGSWGYSNPSATLRWRFYGRVNRMNNRMWN